MLAKANVMSPARRRILVIDDDPQLHRFLAPALDAAGYLPLRADTGRQALNTIALQPPDAVLLDLGLPDLDGKDVLAQARAFYSGPVLILSARASESDKIDALDGGADDYVAKPFSIGELLARLGAALRAQTRSTGATSVISAGDLTIDLRLRLVTRSGRVIHLSPKEYDLLAKLAEAGGKILTHTDLLTAIWGQGHNDDIQYLRVLISQVRQKIEVNSTRPRFVLNEPGVGYRFISAP
jgi:two-component system, OmpR family, KDP operon response regulator KdpE